MTDGDGARVCASCRATLPAVAKFCLECGTPVASLPEHESRRTVTLLFTDVTGSTAMGEQLDPEAYRGIMGRYFEVARAAVERHGGTVEKFVGDAVLAVFGIPEVREDDALRAVRAAWDLGAGLRLLSDELVTSIGVRLLVRTGVNTGSVVAGAARAGGSFATGDAVNTAARLEQAAGPGEILLGATTYALVRDAVEVEPVAPVEAKGKAEPVAAYRLLGVGDSDRGRRRRDDVRLVGRVQETRALDDALDRTVTSGRSHLITVVGPAGIGKSRLVTEFLQRIGDRAEVASGRCVSYGQGITYWPLVQALRGALHLTGTESAEITRHVLDQALGDAGDRDQVAELLLPLLGKTGAPGTTEETFWAVRRLLEALASRRPLVLNVDDLHWAEPTLLELLERVRDEIADLPLLLLCQARPELLEQNPGWGSGALNSLTFGLDPLTPAETGDSVAALLDGRLPGQFRDKVAEWSGGNPLFVEEIVAHLVETGALQRDDEGTWRLADDLDVLRIPPTVSALLASRLDRLPDDERDLLERLSVVGLEVTAADATLLVPPATVPELPRLFASLTRRDLLRRVRSADGESWAFKHVIVRDAAYDGLAKSLRAELHERFADGLAAAHHDETGVEEVTFVAHHLEQAVRYRRELAITGAGLDALVDRAVACLGACSDAARDREEIVASVHHLERALALGPRQAARRRLLARMATIQIDAGALDDLAPTLDRLEDELDDSATEVDRRVLRMLRADRDMSTAGEVDPAEVLELADEVIAAARAAHDDEALVWGLMCRCDAQTTQAQWGASLSNTEEIIRLGRPWESRFAKALSSIAAYYGGATVTHAYDLFRNHVRHNRGEVQEARDTGFRAILAASREDPAADALISQSVAQMDALKAKGLMIGNTLLLEAFAMRHDLDGAIAYAQRINDELRERGDLGSASTYILMQAHWMLERGDDPDDVATLVDEAAGYTSPYDRLSVAFLAGCRAVLAVRGGDRESARALADEGIRVVDETDQVWQQADLRRLLALVARALDDRPWERKLLEEAAAAYRQKEITAYDAELRTRLAELAD